MGRYRARAQAQVQIEVDLPRPLAMRVADPAFTPSGRTVSSPSGTTQRVVESRSDDGDVRRGGAGEIGPLVDEFWVELEEAHRVP